MSSSTFFRLLADPAATSRWYLKSPIDPSGEEVDPRLFTQGLVVTSQPQLTVPLRRAGNQIDFNFCDFDMVVSTARLNAELEKLAGPEIQRFPVTVDSHFKTFEILNVCALVNCIDASRSQVTRWTAADGRHNDVGDYRMITGLKIDAVAAQGHEIFRLAGWPIALVVSEKVKKLFEDAGASGLRFELVS